MKCRGGDRLKGKSTANRLKGKRAMGSRQTEKNTRRADRLKKDNGQIQRKQKTD